MHKSTKKIKVMLFVLCTKIKRKIVNYSLMLKDINFGKFEKGTDKYVSLKNLKRQFNYKFVS